MFFSLANPISAVTTVPIVKAIQTRRVVAYRSQHGNLSRFDTPRKLMSYIDLTPCEHSSGQKRRLSAITKCGNGGDTIAD